VDLLLQKALFLLALATVIAFFSYAAWPRKQQRRPTLSAVGEEEAESR
jgi:hypothetical protein